MVPEPKTHSAPVASVFAALFDGPELTVAKGTRIFRPGDAGHNLFLLRHGLVKLSTRSSKGDEITLRVCRPGEIFGESCFCRDVHRYTATALEDSEIVESPVGRAIDALMRSPALALELIVNLTERLASAYEELQTVSSRVAVTRIATKLLELPGTPYGGEGWTELTNRFTHEELAQIVGVRRETLTRGLARLRDLSVVDYAAGRPIRVHRAGLEGVLANEATRSHV
jgi:CRP/FNR family transcriptional regulator